MCVYGFYLIWKKFSLFFPPKYFHGPLGALHLLYINPVSSREVWLLSIVLEKSSLLNVFDCSLASSFSFTLAYLLSEKHIPQICVIYLSHQRGSCGSPLSHWCVAVVSSCVLAAFIITGVGVQLSFLCLLRKFFFQCSIVMISILDVFLFTVNLFLNLSASQCLFCQ